MLWAWMSLFWVGFTDLYVRLCSWASGTIGELCSRCPTTKPSARRSRHRRGGAGLRAAIEASAAAFRRDGLQMLLGKAHTVMAEGGIAAALAMSMTATIGKCISPTPCAAAVREQLAHGRAAREGSARSRARARSMGRGLRSHEDGRILQGISADTNIRGSRTSAIAPGSK
jgi:hypothetical protein